MDHLQSQSNIELLDSTSKCSRLCSWLFSSSPCVSSHRYASTKCQTYLLVTTCRYPLYRRFDLAKQVYRDTCDLFGLGKRAVLKCLLQVHSIFEQDEIKRILNTLFLTDYCVWIQTVKHQAFDALATRLCAIEVLKADVDWPLAQIEDIVDASDSESSSDVDEHESDDSTDSDDDSSEVSSDNESVKSYHATEDGDTIHLHRSLENIEHEQRNDRLQDSDSGTRVLIQQLSSTRIEGDEHEQRNDRPQD